MNPYEEAVTRKGLTESHRKILDRVPPASKVLEIGPCAGHMSRWLKEEKRCEVVGIEIDSDSGAKARQFASVYIGSVEDGALLERVRSENGLFDYLLFVDVLEHLVSPQEVLLRMKSLLSPKGRILACVPNVAHFSVRVRLLFSRFDYQATGLLDRNHLRFFTKKSVRELFDTAGYEITYFDCAIRGLPMEPFWRLFPGLFGYQFIIEASPLA